MRGLFISDVSASSEKVNMSVSHHFPGKLLLIRSFSSLLVKFEMMNLQLFIYKKL